MNGVARMTDGFGFDSFTRRVGAVHLGLAGLGNVVTGAAVVYAASTGLLVRLLIRQGDGFMTETALLGALPRLTTVGTDLALVVGVAFVLVGLFELVAARWADAGRRWRECVASGALGLLNPAVTPVALVACLLLTLTRSQFAPGESAGDGR